MLAWVKDHTNIKGNAIADNLAKQASKLKVQRFKGLHP